MLGSHSGSVKSGDFGRVVNLTACCSLNDNEKYFLLKCHFCSRTYVTISFLLCFSMCFQSNWLSQFINGLVYYESDNGGYCKYCVLLGKCGSTMKELGILVNWPLIDLKVHQKLVYCFTRMLLLLLFLLKIIQH